MPTGFVSTSPSSTKFLTHEEAKVLSDLFFLDPNAQGRLLRDQKNGSYPPFVVWSVFLVMVGLSCIGLSAAAWPNLAGGIWVVAIIVAAVCLLGIVYLYRRERSLTLFADTNLLKGVITNVATRERADWLNLLLGILAVLGFILEIVAVFSGNGGGSGGLDVGDFYEVIVEYTTTSPTGRQLKGHGKHNRPELRKSGLPTIGTPVLISYVDDDHFKLL